MWLAHRACLHAPVSRSQTVTSLLPCTADTTQDCSVGCVASRRTRAPGDQERSIISMKKPYQASHLLCDYPLRLLAYWWGETGLSGTQTEIHHLLIYKKKWESIIYTLLLCPIPSRKNGKMLPWSDKYFKGGEGKGIHSGTHNHRVNVNLKPYIAFWNLSSYVKKLGETERKYLLDETDSWSAAEIVDPSRLTYQHSSPRSANCDKGPPQRTWSHLINKRQNYCN